MFLLLAKLRQLFLLLVITALVACGSQVELFNGMQESDANDVLSALLQVGIPASKSNKKDGVTLLVPSDLSARALQTLQAQGLPKNKQDGMGQVFKKENLISSPLEERARYLYALSQEIEKTILTMDGVIAARVHIVLPERLAPGEPMLPSSAAVFIKHREDLDFQLYLPKVRNLVFNSIPGLSGDEREKVTIVALPSLKKDSPQARITWVGPFAVESDSADVLKYTLLGGIILWLFTLGGMYAWFTLPALRSAMGARVNESVAVVRGRR
jgi:type III secretion protein J